MLKNKHLANYGFTKITKRDFVEHIYGDISRCCLRNNILYFFSSEKEATGLSLFFFSHNRRYYSALRHANLPNSILEQQITDFLFPDNLSEPGMQLKNQSYELE